MYYPDELVEEVRTKNDIVDVVSEYVRMQKKGANHWGCCPFHNEKTPSFSVNGAKQMYHCFGCGAGPFSAHKRFTSALMASACS